MIAFVEGSYGTHLSVMEGIVVISVHHDSFNEGPSSIHNPTLK